MGEKRKTGVHDSFDSSSDSDRKEDRIQRDPLNSREILAEEGNTKEERERRGEFSISETSSSSSSSESEENQHHKKRRKREHRKSSKKNRKHHNHKEEERKPKMATSPVRLSAWLSKGSPETNDYDEDKKQQSRYRTSLEHSSATSSIPSLPLSTNISGSNDHSNLQRPLSSVHHAGTFTSSSSSLTTDLILSKSTPSNSERRSSSTPSTTNLPEYFKSLENKYNMSFKLPNGDSLQDGSIPLAISPHNNTSTASTGHTQTVSSSDPSLPSEHNLPPNLKPMHHSPTFPSVTEHLENKRLLPKK